MFGRRAQVAVLAFLGLLLVCVGQLAQLQLWKYPKYATAALASLTTEELAPAPRGRILDCNGAVLAEDVPSFDLSVQPGKLQLTELTLQSLRRIREIRRVRPSDYVAAVKGGYAVFGKSDYHVAHAAAFRRICAKVLPGTEPSEEVLKELRDLHYRAERDAAVSRLAARDPLVAELASAASVSREALAAGLVDSMEHEARNYGGDPPPSVRNLPREAWDLLYLRQNYPLTVGKEPFPGVVMTVSSRRHYPQGRTACHVVGYVAPLTEDQYKHLAEDPQSSLWMSRPTPDGKGTQRWCLFHANEGELNWMRPRGTGHWSRSLADERIGAFGAERYYNQHLRGQHAYRTWRLKLQPGSIRGGEPEREAIRSVRPQPGGDVRLTLDLAVQRAAEQALAESGFRGAAVFLDPHTGGIVAMASNPGFDPSVFVTDRGGDRDRLLGDPAKPLLFRATQGTYPPGSVFKIVLGTGALEQKAIGPSTTFTCTHVLRMGRHEFECLGNHGTIDFYTAIQKSCNIYFFHTGMTLERREKGGIGKWGRLFGFGERSGLDLPGERSGIMYSREWKAQRYAGKRGLSTWTDGDTVISSIGQGATEVTPLQAAVAAAAIANGGEVVTPRLALSLTSAWGTDSGGTVKRNVRRYLPLAEGSSTLKNMRRAMADVVSEPGGTGRLARMPNVAVAGKTGSAENPHGRTHAWFCGFAPADDPTIAFAVVLENAGHGGAEAAPVARKVLEVLFPAPAGPANPAPPGTRPEGDMY